MITVSLWGTDWKICNDKHDIIIRKMPWWVGCVCYPLWLQGKDGQVRRELGVSWLFIHAVMLYWSKGFPSISCLSLHSSMKAEPSYGGESSLHMSQFHGTTSCCFMTLHCSMANSQKNTGLGILYQYLPIPKLDNYCYHSQPTSLHDTPLRLVKCPESPENNCSTGKRPRLLI